MELIKKDDEKPWKEVGEGWKKKEHRERRMGGREGRKGLARWCESERR